MGSAAHGAARPRVSTSAVVHTTFPKADPVSPADSRFRNSAFHSLPAAPDDLLGEVDRRWSAPILCGVSDSDAARAAADTAAGLAALLGTSLVLVHVARPVNPFALRTQRALDVIRRTRIHDAREIVEQVCERCALSGMAAVDVAIGDAAVGLASMAMRHRAWMLVIGAPRRPPRRLGRDLSDRLSRLAECPVVVVPPPADPPRRRAAP
jgi:nucleotide-binding universal stress UspA family protein